MLAPTPPPSKRDVPKSWLWLFHSLSAHCFSVYSLKKYYFLKFIEVDKLFVRIFEIYNFLWNSLCELILSTKMALILEHIFSSKELILIRSNSVQILFHKIHLSHLKYDYEISGTYRH
jgi:hypothetical protein